jgi:hypothetical protein
MHPILVLLRKDFTNFFRNKAAVSLTFIVPFVMIYLFGQIFGVNRTNPGPTGIPIAVVNASRAERADRLAVAVAVVPESATVPETVRLPSRGVVLARFTVKVSASLSKTSSVALPLVHPAVLAATVALRVPSMAVLFTALMLKVTLVCPAGSVTLVGTVTRPAGDAARAIVTFTGAAALALTVPVLAVAPSVTLAGSTTLKTAPSLSVMVKLPLPKS